MEEAWKRETTTHHHRFCKIEQQQQQHGATSFSAEIGKKNVIIILTFD